MLVPDRDGCPQHSIFGKGASKIQADTDEYLANMKAAVQRGDINKEVLKWAGQSNHLPRAPAHAVSFGQLIRTIATETGVPAAWLCQSFAGMTTREKWMMLSVAHAAKAWLGTRSRPSACAQTQHWQATRTSGLLATSAAPSRAAARSTILIPSCSLP